MNEYSFTVTKTGYINVEADSVEDAEAKLQENFGHFYVITETGEELSNGWETTGEVELEEECALMIMRRRMMIKSLFTKEQLQDLRKEFVKIKLADMTSEDLFAYIRDIMMNELIDLEEDELRDEIDEYDEYLYEVLAPYVLDQEGSWEIMQEYIQDRQEQW